MDEVLERERREGLEEVQPERTNMDTWDEFGRPLPEQTPISDEYPGTMDRQDLNDEVLFLRKEVLRLRALARSLRRRIERQAVALADAKHGGEEK